MCILCSIYYTYQVWNKYHRLKNVRGIINIVFITINFAIVEKVRWYILFQHIWAKNMHHRFIKHFSPASVLLVIIDIFFDIQLVPLFSPPFNLMLYIILIFISVGLHLFFSVQNKFATSSPVQLFYYSFIDTTYLPAFFNWSVKNSLPCPSCHGLSITILVCCLHHFLWLRYVNILFIIVLAVTVSRISMGVDPVTNTSNT